MILVDSNIPMYLVGADHPNKTAARSALEVVVARRERLVTDAEVIQGILHRYAAIDRRTFIEPAVDAIHLAIMQRHGIARIMTFDDFAELPGIGLYRV